MDDDIATQISDEIEAIDSLLVRLRSVDAPGALEIDQALERGFGRLMSLKAQVRDLRSEQSTDDQSTDQVVTELDQCVSQLSASLVELRVTVSPNCASRIGYGFVLPHRPQRRPSPS